MRRITKKNKKKNTLVILLTIFYRNFSPKTTSASSKYTLWSLNEADVIQIDKINVYRRMTNKL